MHYSCNFLYRTADSIIIGARYNNRAYTHALRFRLNKCIFNGIAINTSDKALCQNLRINVYGFCSGKRNSVKYRPMAVTRNRYRSFAYIMTIACRKNRCHKSERTSSNRNKSFLTSVENSVPIHDVANYSLWFQNIIRARNLRNIA